MLLLLAGVVKLASESEPRQAGSNRIVEGSFVAEMRAPGTLCQDAAIPRDAANLRILIGTYGQPGPELELSIRREGRTITGGSKAAGWPEGHLVIPIQSRGRAAEGDEVCLRALGPGRLAFAGFSASGDAALSIDGRRQSAQMRFEYLRAGEESWTDLLPDIDRRYRQAKADVLDSPLALPITAVLMLLVIAGAVLALWRTRW